eukprot:1270914-Lingulodinium_polyedra.AAC.1
MASSRIRAGIGAWWEPSEAAGRLLEAAQSRALRVATGHQRFDAREGQRSDEAIRAQRAVPAAHSVIRVERRRLVAALLKANLPGTVALLAEDPPLPWARAARQDLLALAALD